MTLTAATLWAAARSAGLVIYDVGESSCGPLHDEPCFILSLTRDTAYTEGGWGDFRLSLNDDLTQASVYDSRGNTDEASYGPLLGVAESAEQAVALILQTLEDVGR